MNNRNFMSMLKANWEKGKFICVGLDSDYKKIPKSAQFNPMENAGLSMTIERINANSIGHFNSSIIQATKDLVCAYKPNFAFYEALGSEGLIVLQNTISDIHEIAPDVPVILDFKRADIGNTNTGSVELAFNYLKADAVTLHPYLGSEALRPFLEQTDKGIIILCRTSNPGAGEFQDLPVETDWSPNGILPLYQYVAMKVAKDWNQNGNCALVVGATYPDELNQIRQIVDDMPILIPGIGAQGGDLKKVVTAGLNKNGTGIVINVSRSVIFSSSGDDFAEAARNEVQKLNNEIKTYREEALS